MLTIAKKSKEKPEEIIGQAVDFFGPNGYKLEVKEQGEGCAVFEGGGGGVQIDVCAQGGETSVELISREWDYQVKEFLSRMK